MYSYNIEQASGHGGHYVVTVIMNEKGVDLDGTLNWLAEHHGQVLSNFLAQYCLLPAWGPAVDADVSAFVERLAYWIRGIDYWSLETERYCHAQRACSGSSGSEFVRSYQSGNGDSRSEMRSDQRRFVYSREVTSCMYRRSSLRKRYYDIPLVI